MEMRILSASMVDAEIDTGINGVSIVFSINGDEENVARHLRKTSVWKECGRLESYGELRVPRDVFLEARRTAVQAIEEKRHGVSICIEKIDMDTRTVIVSVREGNVFVTLTFGAGRNNTLYYKKRVGVGVLSKVAYERARQHAQTAYDSAFYDSRMDTRVFRAL